MLKVNQVHWMHTANATVNGIILLEDTHLALLES